MSMHCVRAAMILGLTVALTSSRSRALLKAAT